MSKLDNNGSYIITVQMGKAESILYVCSWTSFITPESALLVKSGDIMCQPWAFETKEEAWDFWQRCVKVNPGLKKYTIQIL